MNLQFKFFVSGTELRTDKQTDRRTDRQMDGRTDDPITRCPRRTFQAGGIKNMNRAKTTTHTVSVTFSQFDNQNALETGSYLKVPCK